MSVPEAAPRLHRGSKAAGPCTSPPGPCTSPGSSSSSAADAGGERLVAFRSTLLEG